MGDRRVLVIDVGNTHTTLGVMRQREVEHTFRVTTGGRTTDELGMLILRLLEHHGVVVTAIEGAICASVVPSVVYTLEKVCRRYIGVECMLVGRKVKTGMKLRVDNPREVGADRIVNAVAARERWGGPVIVVDFGTATTVDCVNARGEYVGGVIAPGFRISEEALFKQTAKLPRVEVARPGAVIGKNTVAAMQSGLFHGYVGLVDHLARLCREELDPHAKVVATGGYATMMSEASALIQEVDMHLTLRGLALIYARNTGGA